VKNVQSVNVNGVNDNINTIRIMTEGYMVCTLLTTYNHKKEDKKTSKCVI
jgi:hypothetical protein